MDLCDRSEVTMDMRRQILVQFIKQNAASKSVIVTRSN